MQPSPRLDTVRPCPSVRVFMTTEPPAPAPRSQGGIPSPTTGPPAGRYTCLPARPASGGEDLHCTVELADLDLRESRRRRLQLVPHQLSVEGEGGVVTGARQLARLLGQRQPAPLVGADPRDGSQLPLPSAGRTRSPPRPARASRPPPAA